ncbi:MAG: hypothetical protein OHK0046_23060 [Anaerolineae bacterium]
MEQYSDREYIAQLEATITTLSKLLDVSSVLNNAILSEESRLESLLTYLMNAAAEITESEAASVLLWQQTTQELIFVATTTSETSPSLIGKPVPLDSIAGQILTERKLIQVDDVKRDPRHYSKVDDETAFVTRSLLGVPMISKNRVIGVLEVVNKRTLPWTLTDRNNLSMLAAEAAVAIEVAQMVNDLQNANEELQELDKLKNDFISIASHELRTPLGIIMGYASFLQETTDESINVHATKVMGSALRLRAIIEDMINLRYLKQKPSDLQVVRVTLQTIMEDLGRDMLTLSDANRHFTELRCIDPHNTLDVDRGRVTMALLNIVSNALRFTPENGTVTIEARVHNDREAWIAVTDTGIGLEADQLERIFDEFYQVEDHMTRKHGGLGIGLSISRAMIEAHGGRIWADSPGLNQGTTVIVALPLAQG